VKLLITADWHLRDDKPRCRPRNEDWLDFQKECILFVFGAAVKNEVDSICVCGDIFHYPVVSSNIINFLLEVILTFGIPFYILPGQHDLKNHDLDSIFKCSYGTLYSIAKYGNMYIHPMEYKGMTAFFGSKEFHGTDSGLYFTHVLAVPSQKGCNFGNMVKAFTLMEDNPEAKIIFAGDNHEGFIERYLGQTVAVPGCLNRQSIALKDYHPHVLIYDDSLEKSPLSKVFNEKDLCALEIDNVVGNKKTVDVSGLIDTLKGVSVKEFSLSFFDNLSIALKRGDLDASSLEFIQKMVEDIRRV